MAQLPNQPQLRLVILISLKLFPVSRLIQRMQAGYAISDARPMFLVNIGHHYGLMMEGGVGPVWLRDRASTVRCLVAAGMHVQSMARKQLTAKNMIKHTRTCAYIDKCGLSIEQSQLYHELQPGHATTQWKYADT